MLSVAIETMIDEMRSLVMKNALIAPQARPIAPAIANIAKPAEARSGSPASA